MARSASKTLLLAPLLLAACELDFDQKPDDTAVEILDGDGDGWTQGQDCDDSDPDVNPDAAEWCNGIDDDCDGQTDEYDAVDVATWYPDDDDDGYGGGGSTTSCDAPSGWVDRGDDCDDQDGDTYPGAPETCGDGKVNDCDGEGIPCLLSGDIDADDADATLYGTADGDSAGLSVAGAGDVNADGYGDLWVGAPFHDVEVQDAGAAFLVLGPVVGAIDLGLADAVLVGKDTDGGLGSAVASAGDVNGDGFDDLLCGAPYLDSGNTEAGAAFLVLGPAAGEIRLSSADASLSGTERYDWTGWSVAGAGDVNADGYDDLLVGAPYSDKGGANAGAAFLVLGPVSGEFTLRDSDSQLVGEDEQDGAGRAVSSAGDVDGDGVDDVILGAPARSQGGTNAGAAYLVLGPIGSDLDLSAADARLLGEAAHDGAGSAVAGAGDVDGDGLDDLLVGAGGNDVGGSDAGAAYLLSGTVRGLVSLADAQARLTGEALFDRAGAAVAGAGDADGDGLDDLLVGAPSHTAGGTDAGAAYLVLGPVQGDIALGSAGATLIGAQASDHAGSAVSGAGDVNGDGIDDLLAGAPDNNERGAGRGAAYLFTIVDW